MGCTGAMLCVQILFTAAASDVITRAADTMPQATDNRRYPRCSTSSSSSFESCKAAYEAKPTCLQFSYASTAAGATCSTSTHVVLGEAATRQCIEYLSSASKCIRWRSDGGGGEYEVDSIRVDAASDEVVCGGHG